MKIERDLICSKGSQWALCVAMNVSAGRVTVGASSAGLILDPIVDIQAGAG